MTVPHHGSRTSSTPAFVAAVAAGDVIFPVGYRNRFGHPQAAVWERHAGSVRERTDRDGAITYQFGEAGIVRTLHREAGRRYWQGL